MLTLILAFPARLAEWLYGLWHRVVIDDATLKTLHAIADENRRRVEQRQSSDRHGVTDDGWG